MAVASHKWSQPVIVLILPGHGQARASMASLLHVRPWRCDRVWTHGGAEALFEGKTVVWFNDLIIGEEDSIEQIIKDNIQFGPLKYLNNKAILNVDVKNESSVAFQMEYIGNFSFHKRTTFFNIPPKSRISLQVKTRIKKKTVNLPFRILNAVIGPKEYLEHEFLVK